MVSASPRALAKSESWRAAARRTIGVSSIPSCLKPSRSSLEAAWSPLSFCMARGKRPQAETRGVNQSMCLARPRTRGRNSALTCSGSIALPIRLSDATASSRTVVSSMLHIHSSGFSRQDTSDIGPMNSTQRPRLKAIATSTSSMYLPSSCARGCGAPRLKLMCVRATPLTGRGAGRGLEPGPKTGAAAGETGAGASVRGRGGRLGWQGFCAAAFAGGAGSSPSPPAGTSAGASWSSPARGPGR